MIRYYIWNLDTDNTVAYYDVHQAVLPLVLCDRALDMNQAAGYVCHVVATAEEYPDLKRRLGQKVARADMTGAVR